MSQLFPESAAELFSQLAVQMHSAGGLDETVDAVVQFALVALDCTHAGVVVIGPGGLPTIGAVTHPVVEHLYRRQLDAGSGPMLDALDGQRAVYVPNVATAIDWPEWRAEAVAHGIGSVLHMPMATSSRLEGVLSLFHTAPDGFSDCDAAPIADILARHASVAIATARQDENLARAVDARKLIGQAMGILMERFDLDSDQAFAVLERYSQQTNVKLRDVAQRLIDTRHLAVTSGEVVPRDGGESG